MLSFAAQTKGELKDAITRNPRRVTPRTEALIARYKRHPEAYYRGTPFNSRIYHHGDDASFYLGSTRVKRFRRMAEKASRDLVDLMFHQAKTTAEDLAVEGGGEGDTLLFRAPNGVALLLDLDERRGPQALPPPGNPKGAANCRR